MLLHYLAGIVHCVYRGFATGIYTTNSAEACHYHLESASCQIVVVENNVQLQKILQVKDRLPKLRTIVQYKGEPPEDCPEVLSVSVSSFVNGRSLQNAGFKCVKLSTVIYTVFQNTPLFYFTVVSTTVSHFL